MHPLIQLTCSKRVHHLCVLYSKVQDTCILLRANECSREKNGRFMSSKKATGKPPRLHSHAHRNSKLSPSTTFQISPEQHSKTLLDKILRKHEVPSEGEIESLKKHYSEPKKLIWEFLQPLIKTGNATEPIIDFSQRMRGKLWKAKLLLDWPQKMTVCATHRSPEVAIDNVYLLACRLFQDIGLIQGNGSVNKTSVTQDTVLDTLQSLGKAGGVSKLSSNFELTSVIKYDDTDSSWKTNLNVSWPFELAITGQGSTLKASQLEACLLTNIKLKTTGVFNKDNQLLPGRVMRLKSSTCSANITREAFQPDFEIYVDASQVGFGAYLLTKEDSKVRWLADPWPSHFNTTDILPVFESTFFEFYALVSACYTWKHKFVGKKLLCWSDNTYAVTLVNKGLYLIPEKKVKKYQKLYKIIYDMCQKYDITLTALHVHRIDNVAADLLSRSRVEEFREIIPQANEKSKKTKKLLFCHPLTENKPQNKDV